MCIYHFSMANVAWKKAYLRQLVGKKSISTLNIIDVKQLPTTVKKTHLQWHFLCFDCIQQSQKIVFFYRIVKIIAKIVKKKKELNEVNNI